MEVLNTRQSPGEPVFDALSRLSMMIGANKTKLTDEQMSAGWCTAEGKGLVANLILKVDDIAKITTAEAFVTALYKKLSDGVALAATNNYSPKTVYSIEAIDATKVITEQVTAITKAVHEA